MPDKQGRNRLESAGNGSNLPPMDDFAYYFREITGKKQASC
jgi:hypothetical protein